jgi:hypothetical protein
MAAWTIAKEVIGTEARWDKAAYVDRTIGDGGVVILLTVISDYLRYDVPANLI